MVVHNFPPFFIGFSIAWGSGISFEGVYIGLCIAGYWFGTKFLKSGQSKTKPQDLYVQSKHGNEGLLFQDASSNTKIDQHIFSLHVDNVEDGTTHTCYVEFLEKKKKESMKEIQQRLLTESKTVAAGGDPDSDDEEWKNKHPHGKYEENPKHHKNSRGNVSKPPRDGQTALDNSIATESTQRVAIQDGKVVILHQTRPGLYHGYIVEHLNNLESHIKNALGRADLVKNIKSGRLK